MELRTVSRLWRTVLDGLGADRWAAAARGVLALPDADVDAYAEIVDHVEREHPYMSRVECEYVARQGEDEGKWKRK